MSSFAICQNRRAALVGIGFGLLAATAGHALESRTYVIPAASGYGVEDCLGDRAECGRQVADVWCQTYGQGVALDFGRSEATAPSKDSWWAPKRYYVACASTDPR